MYTSPNPQNPHCIREIGMMPAGHFDNNIAVQYTVQTTPYIYIYIYIYRQRLTLYVHGICDSIFIDISGFPKQCPLRLQYHQ